MKKVVVVGLLDSQARRVQQSCGRLRLHFVSARANKPEDHFPNTASACFLLVKFVSHNMTAAAFKQYGRQATHLHVGGVSELVQKLMGLNAL